MKKYLTPLVILTGVLLAVHCGQKAKLESASLNPTNIGQSRGQERVLPTVVSVSPKAKVKPAETKYPMDFGIKITFSKEMDVEATNRAIGIYQIIGDAANGKNLLSDILYSSVLPNEWSTDRTSVVTYASLPDNVMFLVRIKAATFSTGSASTYGTIPRSSGQSDGARDMSGNPLDGNAGMWNDDYIDCPSDYEMYNGTWMRIGVPSRNHIVLGARPTLNNISTQYGQLLYTGDNTYSPTDLIPVDSYFQVAFSKNIQKAIIEGNIHLKDKTDNNRDIPLQFTYDSTNWKAGLGTPDTLSTFFIRYNDGQKLAYSHIYEFSVNDNPTPIMDKYGLTYTDGNTDGVEVSGGQVVCKADEKTIFSFSSAPTTATSPAPYALMFNTTAYRWMPGAGILKLKVTFTTPDNLTDTSDDDDLVVTDASKTNAVKKENINILDVAGNPVPFDIEYDVDFSGQGRTTVIYLLCRYDTSVGFGPLYNLNGGKVAFSYRITGIHEEPYSRPDGNGDHIFQNTPEDDISFTFTGLPTY